MLYFKKILILMGLVLSGLVNAHANDGPQPCIEIYCLMDTVEAFKQSIPLDVEYHDFAAGSTRRIKINTPIIINDQLFKVSTLKATQTNKSHVMIVDYEFSPRENDDCIGRYANLIEYVNNLGFQLKPKKRKHKKTTQKHAYKTQSGIRFEVFEIESADIQVSRNVSEPIGQSYTVVVSLHRGHISTNEDCRLAINFIKKQS